MLNLLRNSINAIKKVSGLDSDASAFITAAGLTDATQKDAVNTLVKDMKASGLWSKMKAVYPMVGGTATSMKFNLKDPRDLDAAFRLTWSGGWTYSATGATPNGTNAYADTKFIPNNNGLSVNNNSISYYSRTSAANGATQFYEIGSSEVFGVTDLYSLFTRRSTDLAGYDSGDYTKNRASFTNTNGSGFYIGKVNSDLTSKLYKNGILSATKSITNQAGLSSFSVFLGGFNEANTVVYY